MRRARDNFPLLFVVVSIITVYLAARSGARKEVTMELELLRQILYELRSLRAELKEYRPAAAPEAPATEANPPPVNPEGETPTEGKRKRKPKTTRRKSGRKIPGILAEIKKGWKEMGREIRQLEREQKKG